MLSQKIRKSAVTVAAIGSLGLGAGAIANAAGGDPGTTTKQASGHRAPGAPPEREPLSSGDAAKVKAAALEEVPGATISRTEAGGPYDTPFHAHIETSDGTAKIVTVDADFEAVDVVADRGPGGRGRMGGSDRPGGPGGDCAPPMPDGRGQAPPAPPADEKP